ncbi:MAG: Flp pilus assembly complex ATPase component TadA, partial [Planctomycetaceae bacterium]|nr:Flp pilus assembly complex ATPase component TadA [Planctomycetaceae bacterium]
MTRCLFIPCFLLIVFLTAFSAFAADDAAADDKLPAWIAAEGAVALKDGWLGPGNYFSITKIILFIVIFWLFVYTADWINRDAEHRHVEERETQNLNFFLVYVIGSAAAFYIPIFWVAYPVTVLVWIVPTIIYVRERNKVVQEHEKVWTHDHLALVTATLLSKVGIKMKVQKRAVYEGGVPVEVKPTSKKLDKATLDARLILSRNSPGFNDFRAYVYDGILRNADSIMFDFTPQNTLVRHQIDGVWIEIVNVPRSTEKGKQKDKLEFALEAGKMLVGANVEDRRSRQGGTFTATVQKTKYNCEFMSQGTQTGEAVAIQLSRDKVAFKSLEDVGMNPVFQDKLRTNLNAKKGLFIISAPPANGLRSSTDVFIRSSDRFTRDVTAVEDEQNKYNDIENVLMMRYDSSKGETPITLLPDIFFKEPHAVILRDMVNTESLNLCLKEINNSRLIITTVRAKDAAEAILRIAAMKADMQLFAAGLNGVICQRLIRKLCPDCKEPFQPS